MPETTYRYGTRPSGAIYGDDEHCGDTACCGPLPESDEAPDSPDVIAVAEPDVYINTYSDTASIDGVEYRFTDSWAGTPGSPQAFMAAFDFLSRNANGRYSDRTLMSINRWSGRAAEVLSGDIPEPGGLPPAVFSVGSEVTYDEDTEVKRGGMAAVAVTLPAESGNRLVIATAPGFRRFGLGAALVRRIRERVDGVHAWVGNHNLDGQRFLLSCGMYPISMNSSQALMYAWYDIPEQDGVAR